MEDELRAVLEKLISRPFVYYDELGESFCAYCEHGEPDHEEDCPIVEGQRLLTRRVD